MEERLHQLVIENNSTIYKTKILALDDFKKLYNVLNEEQKREVEESVKDNGYLTYTEQNKLLFRILANIVINNKKQLFKIMVKHEILPKQEKSKKLIPEPALLEFIENTKTKITDQNVDLLREVFEKDKIFNFYDIEALKIFSTVLFNNQQEELLFKLIRANVRTATDRKNMYIEIYEKNFSKLTMRDIKALREDLSFLKDKVVADSYDLEETEDA
jgi:hypothetical protein